MEDGRERKSGLGDDGRSSKQDVGVCGKEEVVKMAMEAGNALNDLAINLHDVHETFIEKLDFIAFDLER